QFVRLGQWPLALQVFQELVQRYPNHALAADSYRWLIRFGTSSEARRRQELGQFWVVSQTAVRASQEHVQSDPTPESVVVQTNRETMNRSSQLGMVRDLKDIRDAYSKSLELGKRFATLGALYATEPSIQFCLQAANRQLGDFEK